MNTPSLPSQPSCPPRRFNLRPVLATLLFSGCALLGPVLSAGAADAGEKIAFDIPSGLALDTFKQFSSQSNVQLLYAAEDVDGIRTNAIKGDFGALEALNQMLADTTLYAVRDQRSGALAVNRKAAAADRPRNDPAEPPTASNQRNLNETIKMDPFEVKTDTDTGYGALNSNSITAFSVELNQLPITADILDQAFIRDVGGDAGSMETLIQTYSAGAGTYTPEAASTAAQQQPNDRNGSSGFALRGLDAVTLKVNGFMNAPTSSSGYTSLFTIESVEVINGPQSLLYGTSGPGGVINEVSKQARLGQPAFGSVEFQVDQYGNRLGQFDFGAGNGSMAVRVAVVDQTVGGRRSQIGGPLDGDYVQLAFRLFHNTVVRIQGQETTFDRIIQTDPTVLLGSATFDSRNGDNLHYLLATNQIAAAASGPSGSGAIDNGAVNWSNVDSYDAWYESQKNITTFESLSADTRWSDWLSSQLNVGYDSKEQYRAHNASALMLLGPTFSTNPLGTWAVGTKKNHPIQIDHEPSREKAIRFSFLATNDFLDGRAHSHSIVGADFDRYDESELYYSYFKADGNFNPITGTAAANNGRTIAPLIYWPVTNGPMTYPFFAPDTPQISLNGSNYVKMITNEVSPAAVSPIDPQGVTLGGSTNQESKDLEKGVYGVNYTDWMDNTLETLAGFRLHNTYSYEQTAGMAPPAAPGTVVQAGRSFLAFNLGANYKLTNWLRPYVSFSSSYEPPVALNADPDGNPPQTAHSLGEEVGLKMQSPDGRISGSIAFYHANSKNEQYAISSVLVSDINPSGLNGANGAEDQYINVNRESSGVQAALTAAPTPDWRLRLTLAATDGTVQTTKSYGQLYNDQFYENSQGQVTYADGTVVYVPAAFNASHPVSTATTAGAVPLTVAAMSDPTNPYYAAPQPITGAIGGSQNVVTVLSTVDPVHGAILTGRTGLPISALQINPAPSGVVIPGSIVAAEAGDTTVGYPKLSANVTSVYTFTSGWLNGFRAGGTAIGSWDYAAFYYLSNPTSTQRNLFKLPITPQFNAIFGYEHKFGRVTWSTQLNIDNVFNHYKVFLIPDEVAGYTTPSLIEATFSQQPRSYVWSNTISF